MAPPLPPGSRRAITVAALSSHLASTEAALAHGESAGVDPQSVYLAALRALVTIFRRRLRQDLSARLGETA